MASDVVPAFSLPDTLCLRRVECLDQAKAHTTTGDRGTATFSRAIGHEPYRFSGERRTICCRGMTLFMHPRAGSEGLYATNHTKPIAIDLDVTSTSTGLRETTGKRRATATHQVRAHCRHLWIPSGARQYATCSDCTWQHIGCTCGLHSWPSGNCCQCNRSRRRYDDPIRCHQYWISPNS